MTTKDATILISEIRKLNPKLNEYESKFIRALECYFRDYPGIVKISKKQGDCLQGIYRKVTGGGLYQKKEYIKR